MIQGLCILCYFFCVCFGASIKAQIIQLNSPFQIITSNKSFKISYENDIFKRTDRDYTQGTNIEIIHPKLKKNPLNYVLFKKSKFSVYGLSAEQNSFTPKEYVSSQIQFHDRPFAAKILLNSFIFLIDSNRNSCVSSMISFGVIGPIAIGNETQTKIHEWVGSPIPGGWKNQINNDVLINYHIGLEKSVFKFRNFLELNAHFSGQVGTMKNQVAVGNTIFIGNSKSLNTELRSVRFYGYFRSSLNFIGYDASLQGGLFNQSSVYVISRNDISRILFSAKFELVLQIRRLRLGYSQSYLSKAFIFGREMNWGGISIGYQF